MKKVVKGIMVATMLFVAAACGNKTNDEIALLTREQGSGTRGAFIELFGIEQKNEKGEKVDHTSELAEETNSTSVMITTVKGNPNAIGYISLGSLNADVKALKIDGVEATTENVKNGTYKVARPFNIVTKEELSEVAADFVKFIMSEQGQKVIEDAGFVSQGNEGTYTPSGLTGKITIGGSSSVYPAMEKLQEAYIKLNSGVTIDVQQNDSTSGVTGAIDGLYDIGMASRELKDTETSKGVKGTVIAMDGIAVIVNNENTLDALTTEQVFKIFTGEITTFSEVK